ncbi:ribosome maturation factor RimM [Pectinatus haikarae]|uniref:ribosome maturation factor RimM n=1 Tax=Pectinatus haikarae TaxID=349096 RepID=UPI0018C7DD69|nr:ribosome maturation factor RimM [Pectinatus haikarae]
MEKLSKCVTDKNFIVVGKIGRPHGIRGAIRVYPLTDFPERFLKMRSAYIDDTLVEINTVQYHNDFIIMDIKGFDDREKAAAATGKLLRVERGEAAPLAEGEYYTFDIVGLKVWNEEGIVLGTIINVLKTGSNDVYVIKSTESAEPILLPALKKVVTKIDIEHKRMDVIWPEKD